MPTIKCCSTFVLLAIVPSLCHAKPVIVTWSGNGSGVLGSTAFVNSDFTFTSIGDTDSDIVDGYPATRFNSEKTTLSLNDQGTFEVQQPLQHFINEPSEFAGFNIGGGTRLSFRAFEGAVPASWPNDFRSNLGPVTAIGSVLQWEFFSLPTSGGAFTFTEETNMPLTFQIRVVPEPGSSLLLGAIALMILPGRQAPVVLNRR